MAPLQASGAIVWAVVALAGYALLTVFYNIFLHPLRHFPGPLAYRASRLPRAVRILRGRWTRDLQALVETYGPVVRVAPGQLVYTHADAWRDIYGHQRGGGGGDDFEKDPRFYRARGVPPNVLSETRDNHALLRRQLSHGFSERSLRAQEPIVRGYVDLLVAGLRARCRVGGGGGGGGDGKTAALDLKTWFNFATFDVIGDLAFGEPFGCLAKGAMDERVAVLDGGLRLAAKTYFVREMGLERYMSVLFRPILAFRRELVDKTAAVLRRRMALSVERPDLIEGLLRKKDDWNISFDRLRANATLLIIAGSETTATLLSGTTYLLLKNPECLEKLQHEIRSKFKSEDEITFSSVEDLPYMLAVFKEASRRYPPVAGEMPRIVPRGGAHILGDFVPAGTTVAMAQYPAYHSSRNFSDPFAFRPERFLEPERFAADSFDVLRPFGVGPRNCIGKHLAYAEMHTILARLVYNFDMELVHPERDWTDQNVFFLWTKPSLDVYLTPVVR